ncbi:hypothetical protein Tco_1508295, partial [Tanacetum coccineum]
SQPSRPTFGEDEIRNLVRDALGQIPLHSQGVGDSIFEDNVGESSQSSHRRVEDENVGESSKTSDDSADDIGESSNAKKSNKPAKVLRYFPLIPRLKRLYMSEKTAKDMRWHNMGRTMDGKLRHPADGLAWKGFDARYSDFASDPRSVRLGLASDGLCMKQQSFILSSVIPGEKAPGNDIDVYLQPLIHELKLLWKGVDAYDAFSKQKFKLRASLMWTVNDFPAYANLSGWSTKGRVACPVCANSTRSSWLKYGRKFCYMGHRRWLEQNHKYRFQNDQFDGTCEEEGPPTPLTRFDILEQLSGASFIYGKSDNSSNKSNKRTRDGVGCSTNANDEANAESSAFEDIENFVEEETGEHLHNLDVMHIEKNVCDNLLGTLLNLDGKTKDNENSRKDLMEMGIRHDLHLINRPNKKPYMPPACYTMSSAEKSNFLQVLKNLKVPDGYSSNISRGVLQQMILDQCFLGLVGVRLRPTHRYQGLWISDWLRRFDFPQSKDVDDVVFSHLRDKFRTLKHRIKKSLLSLAAKRLHEANNFDGEMQYTDDEILQALDLVEAPHYLLITNGNLIRIISEHLKQSNFQHMGRKQEVAKSIFTLLAR